MVASNHGKERWIITRPMTDLAHLDLNLLRVFDAVAREGTSPAPPRG
jgi:hypothetical protein